jgi:hypothetical protein
VASTRLQSSLAGHASPFLEQDVEEDPFEGALAALNLSAICWNPHREMGNQNIAMDETFGKSFAKAQQLHGVSLSSFVASVSLSALIFTVEVLVFLIIRKRFPDL